MNSPDVESLFKPRTINVEPLTPPNGPLSVTLMPASECARAFVSAIPACSRAMPVTAVILAGISCADSDRRVAVTITSCKVMSSATDGHRTMLQDRNGQRDARSPSQKNVARGSIATRHIAAGPTSMVALRCHRFRECGRVRRADERAPRRGARCPVAMSQSHRFAARTSPELGRRRSDVSSGNTSRIRSDAFSRR